MKTMIVVVCSDVVERQIEQVAHDYDRRSIDATHIDDS